MSIEEYRLLGSSYQKNTYKEKYHKSPPNLDALVKKGVIKEIPRDTYEGTFYIDAEGEIRTTSEYILLPRQK
jgi:hypothetical protein